MLFTELEALPESLLMNMELPTREHSSPKAEHAFHMKAEDEMGQLLLSVSSLPQITAGQGQHRVLGRYKTH